MGSKYLCLDCFEIYDSSFLNIGNPYEEVGCPKAGCSGYVVEIDELMLPIITILNAKGYFTRYCCSGHYYDCPNAYIMFEDDVRIPDVPEGFKKEIDRNHVTIRATIPRGTHDFDYFPKILDNAKILLQWAKDLPFEEELYDEDEDVDMDESVDGHDKSNNKETSV